MPRNDPTFTVSDLIRFYCRNIAPDEKYYVMKMFNDHIKNGVKICPDDPEERIDPCEWIQKLRELLLVECPKRAKNIEMIIQGLATVEIFIGVLSWSGPQAPILRILTTVIGYMIVVLTFVAALLNTLYKFGGPIIYFANDYFCTGTKPLPLPKPPDIDLPEDPERKMDSIMNLIDSFIDWLSEDEKGDLPPDVLSAIDVLSNR